MAAGFWSEEEGAEAADQVRRHLSSGETHGEMEHTGSGWLRTSTGLCTRVSEKQTSACNWPSPTPVNMEEHQKSETVERPAELQ